MSFSRVQKKNSIKNVHSRTKRLTETQMQLLTWWSTVIWLGYIYKRFSENSEDGFQKKRVSAMERDTDKDYDTIVASIAVDGQICR